MADADLRERISAGYRTFARRDAAGRSPVYAAWAEGVADDPEVLELIAGWPSGRRMPMVLFAAVRLLAGTPPDYAGFRASLFANVDEVVGLVMTRTTQTNEPARCAALLPWLSALPQPIALLEIGASAGLCLLPDRYAYAYAAPGRDLVRLGTSAVEFPVEIRGDLPVPHALPEVVWRAGLDIDPVDLGDEDRVQWLRTLVWPGMDDRLRRLDAAIEIAREDPPPVHRGDLRTDLAALAATAPTDATLVVIHTVVLLYVPREDRAAVVDTIAGLGAVWLCNEAAEVLDEVCEPAPGGAPAGALVIRRDGRPQAWADPHGRWLQALDR